MARISKETQNRIDSVISNIPNLTGGITYPEIGLAGLAELLDIQVAYGDLNIGDGKEYDGAIKKDKDSARSIILINSNRPVERQRFTLAHELGHFFLHSKKGETLYRLDETDYLEDIEAVETEANYFAASILMPERQFMERVRRGERIEDIADFFGVSLKAAVVRLRWIADNE